MTDEWRDPSWPTEIVNVASDVVTHLAIPDDQVAARQDELQGFVDAATKMIEASVNAVIPVLRTERHTESGCVLAVDRYPVLAVTAVTENGIDATALWSVDNEDAGTISRSTQLWCTTFLVVTYVTGRATVPADLRLAVLEDIRGLYGGAKYPRKAGSGNPTDQSGGRDIKVNPVTTFPRVAALLSGYKTPSIG